MGARGKRQTLSEHISYHKVLPTSTVSDSAARSTVSRPWPITIYPFSRFGYTGHVGLVDCLRVSTVHVVTQDYVCLDSGYWMILEDMILGWSQHAQSSTPGKRPARSPDTETCLFTIWDLTSSENGWKRGGTVTILCAGLTGLTFDEWREQRNRFAGFAGFGGLSVSSSSASGASPPEALSQNSKGKGAYHGRRMNCSICFTFDVSLKQHSGLVASPDSAQFQVLVVVWIL